MQDKIYKVKIFEVTHKFVKSMKVFSLEIFKLYGTTPLDINNLGHEHTRTRTHILTIRTGSILKTHGKTRLVQYVITAKNPFKTSIDTL